MTSSANDNSDPPFLTLQQSHALFDILTHRETYAEIENFKFPGTIDKYGPPFQGAAGAGASTSPILQMLLSRFVLKLPGLRDVTPEFWTVRVAELIDDLSAAELSESYDKGVLGIRKTLATAVGALIEYPARGFLGGFAEDKQRLAVDRKYDTADPDDVLQAWKDCLQAAVYGDLIDRVFDKTAQTDDLEEHPSLVQATHEFVLVNLASILHYTLVLSPEGPSILRMIENVHRLLPYTMVRQTLKIGNVASMLSGIMRIILAKVSVASVTNWIGLSSGADEGMNLLQQIISQVLGWEKRELKHRASKIEKDKDCPPKVVLDELKDWINHRTREEHEECRRQSKEQSKSIVMVILSLSTVSDELSEAQHAKAQQYLALNLSVRDRQEIIRVLCHRNPDHLTAGVKAGVDAYTPMIRHVHQAVNLSDTLWDFERFVTDMLKISKPQGKKGAETPASVEDFVDLLHRHQRSTHKFLHQVAKNGKEVTRWWHEYCDMAIAQFRVNEKHRESDSVVPEKLAAGGAQERTRDAFSKLSRDDRKAIVAELAAHQRYLDELHAASAARIGAVIKRQHTTPYGPGAYLARWQHLMDSTPVTPATAEGPVRYGSSRSVKEAGRTDIDGKESSFVGENHAQKAVDERTPNAPSVDTTLRLLGATFREVLVQG